jgi:hypothetical protein
MVHFSSVLAAGLVGILAWDFYAAPRALDAGADASVVASAEVAAAPVRSSAVPATSVDRTRKGDRLTRLSAGDGSRPEIAKVEVGPGQTILLRDRAGGTLFAVDPAAQRTIIAKNVTLPQLTLQTTASGPAPNVTPAAPVQSVPAVDREPSRATVSTGRKPEAKRPTGCDPAFSPITAPELAHIFGRCVTSIEAPTRLASAQ